MIRRWLGVALLSATATSVRAQLPESQLAVEVDAGWQVIWRSSASPARWDTGHPAVRAALRWRAASDGIDVAELRLAGVGEAWRLRAIITRVDPRRVRLRLTFGAGDSLGAPGWRVTDAAGARLAVNAGQFSGRRPWGWIVRDGSELQPPGSGRLTMALVFDSVGAAHLVPPGELARWRGSAAVRQAFQSYPTLLHLGVVPVELRSAGHGVDVTHRDARLALGRLPDGRLLLVLTRFEGFGGTLDLLPFGLTTPEAAALLGALGARDAVLLDGGISGQLLLREGRRTRSWPGLRGVPLALVAR